MRKLLQSGICTVLLLCYAQADVTLWESHLRLGSIEKSLGLNINASAVYHWYAYGDVYVGERAFLNAMINRTEEFSSP